MLGQAVAGEALASGMGGGAPFLRRFSHEGLACPFALLLSGVPGSPCSGGLAHRLYFRRLEHSSGPVGAYDRLLAAGTICQPFFRCLCFYDLRRFMPDCKRIRRDRGYGSIHRRSLLAGPGILSLFYMVFRPGGPALSGALPPSWKKGDR